jgi:hypothetical protein
LREEVQEGLRSLVLRASPSAWQTLDQRGLTVRQLSVEDIFVALVGRGAIVA